MKNNSNFYIVDKKVLPEVFLKVVEVKNLMDNNNAKNIQEAVNIVGISRSSFYKYKDYIFPLNENLKGKTLTIACNLDNTRGLLSNLLNVIASDGANILTINQTIPINNIANITITIDTVNIVSEVELLMDKLKKIKGVQTLKIIAREWIKCLK